MIFVYGGPRVISKVAKEIGKEEVRHFSRIDPSSFTVQTKLCAALKSDQLSGKKSVTKVYIQLHWCRHLVSNGIMAICREYGVPYSLA